MQQPKSYLSFSPGLDPAVIMAGLLELLQKLGISDLAGEIAERQSNSFTFEIMITVRPQGQEEIARGWRFENRTDLITTLPLWQSHLEEIYSWLRDQGVSVIDQVPPIKIPYVPQDERPV